jgi:hypothetical protein
MLSHYVECHILFTIMLNVIMLSVVMLNVVMLSVVAPLVGYSDKHVSLASLKSFYSTRRAFKLSCCYS